MVTEIGVEVAPGPRLVGQPVIVTVTVVAKSELVQPIIVAVDPPVFVRINVCVFEPP